MVCCVLSFHIDVQVYNQRQLRLDPLHHLIYCSVCHISIIVMFHLGGLVATCKSCHYYYYYYYYY
jgi:hypothetical protein